LTLPSSSRDFRRNDQNGQYELPFPVAVGTEIASRDSKSASGSEPPSLSNAKKASSSQNSKLPRPHARGQKEFDRKLPAKEILPPNEEPPISPEEAPGDFKFLRLPEVKAVTGLSKTSLYALIREKSFPAPVRLGPRAVAWVKSEIRQWAKERVHASRSAA
jgi:prophage regulatory protein